MLYARKISEDGWFGKDDLDSDSISELGTSNHQLSVWKIENICNQTDVDNIALALAMTKSKIEELYMVFLNPSDLTSSYNWNLSFDPQDGDTRFALMKKEHTNIVVKSIWEQGFLSEYIHGLIKDAKNYIYYDVIELRRLFLDAYKAKKIPEEDLDGQWKKAIKDLK